MDLDLILKSLGQFGKYQTFCYVLLLFPIMLCSYRSTEYIFTTMRIPHRCRVPECEGLSEPAEFNTTWLKAAIPHTDNEDSSFPEPCLRYRPLLRFKQTTCSADLFNQSITETCDDWVFSEPTRTIANDFNILCPEDYWKLTFLSSCTVITSFIGLPLAGVISDRIGRKTVMVCGCVLLAISGVIRSFSISYVMSVSLELFDGLLSDGVHATAFILGLEILSSSKRLLGSLLINNYFVLGEVVLALVMWAVADWRILLRILYAPCLVLGAIYWLLPESVWWLYNQRRFEEIEGIFRRIAKVNGTEDELPIILSQLQAEKIMKDKGTTPSEKPEKPLTPNKLKAVIKSRIIMFRVAACSLCWFASLFTYYGISQYTTLFENSNRYLSFLLVSLIEVPADVAILWLPDWPLLGRQGTIAWSFFLCGISCFILTFVSHAQVVLSLTLFLIGKFGSTITLNGLYIYTAELFPTEVRQSLFSISSMVGRFGSVMSQQTPLISLYFNPMILYGPISILGGLMILMCPETLNTRLPDTIEEAENIGKSDCPQSPAVQLDSKN